VELAVAEDDRAGPVPDEIGAKPELFDELDCMPIGLEEVVVELLEPGTVGSCRLEARGQASGEWLPLEDGHVVAALDQPQRRCHPESASPEDSDPAFGHQRATVVRTVPPGPS
jgi:hypothetical protein